MDSQCFSSMEHMESLGGDPVSDDAELNVSHNRNGKFCRHEEVEEAVAVPLNDGHVHCGGSLPAFRGRNKPSSVVSPALKILKKRREEKRRKQTSKVAVRVNNNEAAILSSLYAEREKRKKRMTIPSLVETGILEDDKNAEHDYYSKVDFGSGHEHGVGIGESSTVHTFAVLNDELSNKSGYHSVGNVSTKGISPDNGSEDGEGGKDIMLTEYNEHVDGRGSIGRVSESILVSNDSIENRRNVIDDGDAPCSEDTFSSCNDDEESSSEQSRNSPAEHEEQESTEDNWDLETNFLTDGDSNKRTGDGRLGSALMEVEEEAEDEHREEKSDDSAGSLRASEKEMKELLVSQVGNKQGQWSPGGVTELKTTTKENKSTTKKRIRRQAFLNKIIVVRPELYHVDESPFLHHSSLPLLTDQVLKAKIVGVPRPSQNRNYFTLQWIEADRVDVNKLNSTIPNKPMYRALLSFAIDAAEGHDNEEKSGDEAIGAALGGKPVSKSNVDSKNLGISSVAVGTAKHASSVSGGTGTRTPTVTGSSRNSRNEYDVNHTTNTVTVIAESVGNFKATQRMMNLIFDLYVVPILQRAGWTCTKKARVLDSELEQNKKQITHYDVMYMPPGVHPRPPFKKRADYFDSKKQVLNYMESEKCANDPVVQRVLAFMEAAEQLIGHEAKLDAKQAKKRSRGAKNEVIGSVVAEQEDETFSERLKRVISRANQESLQCQAMLSLEGDEEGTAHKTTYTADIALALGSASPALGKEQEQARPTLVKNDNSISNREVTCEHVSEKRNTSSREASHNLASNQEVTREDDMQKTSTSSSVASHAPAHPGKRLKLSTEVTSHSLSNVLDTVSSTSKKSKKRKLLDLDSSREVDILIIDKNIETSKVAARNPKKTKISSTRKYDYTSKHLPKFDEEKQLSYEENTKDSKSARKVVSSGKLPRIVKKAVTVDPERIGRKAVCTVRNKNEDLLRTIPSEKEHATSTAQNSFHDFRSTECKKNGFHHFVNKYKRVREIDFEGTGIHGQKVNKSMWGMHKKIYGDKCDENCACPSDLPRLIKSVCKDQLYCEGDKIILPGFCKYFAPKFYAKVRELFPTNNPAEVLNKLTQMWLLHMKERRFGIRCTKACNCIEGWEALFKTKCLILAPGLKGERRSCDQEKIKLPSSCTKRNHAGNISTLDAGVMVPRLRRSLSAVPAAATLLARKHKENTFISTSVESSFHGKTLGTKKIAMKEQQYTQREYHVTYNAREPLGFFCITEKSPPPRTETVCKITSVSPCSRNKDTRIQIGTIVIAAHVVAETSSPTLEHKFSLSSFEELKEIYKNAKAKGKKTRIRLWFINTDVVSSRVPVAGVVTATGLSRKGDWSSSGSWQGHSAVPGWAGGASLVRAALDKKAVMQLKQWRHFPSVSQRQHHTITKQWEKTEMDQWRTKCSSKAKVIGLQPRSPVLRSEHRQGCQRKQVSFAEHLNEIKVIKVVEEGLDQSEGVGLLERADGMRKRGNDILSYAVLHEDYKEVLRLLRGGAHVLQKDSTGKLPMDHVNDALSFCRDQERFAGKEGSPTKLHSVKRDFELKKKVLKCFLEAERLIDLAQNVKYWHVVKLTVLEVKDLQLTREGQEYPSNDTLFCTFDYGMQNMQSDVLLVSFRQSFSWKNNGHSPKYIVEYNTEIEDSFRKDREVVVNLFKGSPTAAKIKLGSWRETVENIDYYSRLFEEKEIHHHFRGSKFLSSGSIVVKVQTLPIDEDFLLKRRAFISKRLTILLDWIEAFQQETSSAELGANLVVPICGELSLLHAAVYTVDSSLVERLLLLGSDPLARSIVGTPLGLATYLLQNCNSSKHEKVHNSLEKIVTSLEQKTLTLKMSRELSENKANGVQSSLSQREKIDEQSRPSQQHLESHQDAHLDHVGAEQSTDQPLSLPYRALLCGKKVKDTGPEQKVLHNSESSIQTSKHKKIVDCIPQLSDATAEASQCAKKETFSFAEEVKRCRGSSTPQIPKIPNNVKPVQFNMKASTKLPLLQRKGWMEKQARCHFFKKGNGCRNGQHCKYEHVHPSLGSLLEKDVTLNCAQEELDRYVPCRFVYYKQRTTEDGETFYTSGFCHPNDNVIYYAEQGNNSSMSTQGLYWYPDQLSALSAVQRVVFTAIHVTTMCK